MGITKSHHSFHRHSGEFKTGEISILGLRVCLGLAFFYKRGTDTHKSVSITTGGGRTLLCIDFQEMKPNHKSHLPNLTTYPAINPNVTPR